MLALSERDKYVGFQRQFGKLRLIVISGITNFGKFAPGISVSLVDTYVLSADYRVYIWGSLYIYIYIGIAIYYHISTLIVNSIVSKRAGHASALSESDKACVSLECPLGRLRPIVISGIRLENSLLVYLFLGRYIRHADC